jgi:hypothetical protein
MPENSPQDPRESRIIELTVLAGEQAMEIRALRVELSQCRQLLGEARGELAAYQSPATGSTETTIPADGGSA